MSANCCCSSEACRVYGCQAGKQGANPQVQYGVDRSAYIPTVQQYAFIPQFSAVSPTTIGCICPPTSEQTCQRPDCGRKPAGEAKA